MQLIVWVKNTPVFKHIEQIIEYTKAVLKHIPP